MAWVAGVDGCRGGWVVVLVGTKSRDGKPSQVRLCADFTEVLALDPKPAVIAIDIPIGLLDAPRAGGRVCDQAARRLLGRRGSSVFSPPIRKFLTATSYKEVQGVSKQAYNILPKIREVDRLMTPALQAIVYEAHPELAFLSLRNGEPMRFNKKTVEGRRERLRTLEQVPSGPFPGLSLSFVQVLQAFTRRQVAPDDLLDACALAWTALRIAAKKAKRVRADTLVDRKGLRMEIWY
jgi:predicted RNase H-like nuclease